MAQASYMTEEGLANLKKELEYLLTVERPAISMQISEARDKGDLSENAEYDAAKEAQGMLEMKIARLEDILSKVRVIDESKINTSQVQILNKVKLMNLKTRKQVVYTLVSEGEVDIKKGKISVATPIARGLLGKKVGDVVEIRVPSGVLSFEILEISV
jgi:transcription elongation factor GreA